MSCVGCEQSGHCGVVCVSGSIWCRYVLRNGDLFVRNCASVLRVLCESVCSVVFVGSGFAFSMLL